MTQGLVIAILAAACMAVEDVLATITVQAEAGNHGWLAGLTDMLAWYFAIATTTISVTSLNGHALWPKIWVLSLVGISNVLGTKLGQVSGKRILSHRLSTDDKLKIRAVSRK